MTDPGKVLTSRYRWLRGRTADRSRGWFSRGSSSQDGYEVVGLRPAANCSKHSPQRLRNCPGLLLCHSTILCMKKNNNFNLFRKKKQIFLNANAHPVCERFNNRPIDPPVCLDLSLARSSLDSGAPAQVPSIRSSMSSVWSNASTEFCFTNSLCSRSTAASSSASRREFASRTSLRSLDRRPRRASMRFTLKEYNIR